MAKGARNTTELLHSHNMIINRVKEEEGGELLPCQELRIISSFSDPQENTAPKPETSIPSM
jgi:hypothetical protein